MKTEFFELSNPARFVGAASEFLWQGALVVLIVVLLDILFGRHSPRFAYGVNLLGMILLSLCLPINWLSTKDATVSVGEPLMTWAVGENLLSEPDLEKQGLSVQVSTFKTEQNGFIGSSSLGSMLETHATKLTIGYLCGVVFLLIRLFAAVQGGRRLKRSAQPIVASELSTLVDRISEKFHLKIVPAISYCGRVTCPAIVGVLKPVILIPMSVTTQLSSTQLEAVLADELAHLKRSDHLVLLFQRIVEALFFFHPAVWLLSRRLERTRELCCDDLVLSSGTDASDLCGRYPPVRRSCGWRIREKFQGGCRSCSCWTRIILANGSGYAAFGDSELVVCQVERIWRFFASALCIVRFCSSFCAVSDESNEPTGSCPRHGR